MESEKESGLDESSVEASSSVPPPSIPSVPSLPSTQDQHQAKEAVAGTITGSGAGASSGQGISGLGLGLGLGLGTLLLGLPSRSASNF